MHRIVWFIAVVSIWSIVPDGWGQSLDIIPSSEKLVTDQAGMLSSTEEQALTSVLRAYHDSTSTQMVIVTLPHLGGADIATYATELGQQWGVGQQGKDNGVVILVSRDDRDVFIAVGYGLEGRIPDAVVSRIIRGIIIPNFRQGLIYAGLAGAVDALILAAAGEFTEDHLPPDYEDLDDEDDPFGALFVIIIIVLFVISSRRRGGGHRGGGLPFILWSGGHGGSSSGGGFGGGFGGGGFGGFGGGGFGGGGAGGSW